MFIGPRRHSSQRWIHESFNVGVLIALLCLPLVAASNNVTIASPARKTREYSSRGHTAQWEAQHIETLKSSGVLTYREIQNLLRREGGEDGAPVECCPTVEELSEPVGGKNREERYVELYRDGENKQVFYEYSCRPDVLDQPCRFVDRKLSNQSRCVQRFSYTYALVSDPRSRSSHQAGTNDEYKRRHGRKPENVLPDISTITTPGTNWSLDYIRVRSGCSCELLPKQKKKKNGTTYKNKKSKNKWRKARDRGSVYE
ncbi:uncharacterized protein [Venturia canescens]|uniref:uncharacterized protein n=1 Tax=Venturia canescens TaxID=32260 RepID=UPI001C9C23C2|nr:uncharacterized protein LOC122412648 [Venturia canescens]XP_043278298.1 uncharacterized protein LOC122412648 [Venturia canescens]XP_043278299.1 uncharacterized protein LOC122412648 [Venturia canescens]